MTDPIPVVDPAPVLPDPVADPLPDSVPIIPRSAWQNSTTKALADAMTLVNDPISVQRRWGIVQSINDDYTLDILLSGQVVQGISYNATYAPAVGDTVQIDVVGPDMVVMGPMAPSLLNPGSRLGTVTSVNATRTAVTFTADDGTVLSNVPALAPYVPYVNDSVLGIPYQGQFYVIGSEHATAQPVRRAVGDIESSLTVKPGTLALTGQLVSRTTYSQLWAWVQANSLVVAGLFTTGDGSTTFGLPDFRGRSPVGAGVFGGVTYAMGGLTGAASQVLTTAQMPAHNHSPTATATATATTTVADHAGHTHSFGATTSDVSSDHSHSGTTANDSPNHTHGGGTSGNDTPNHTHSGTTANDAPNHTHGGTTTSDGDHGGHVAATGTVAGGSDAPASSAALVNSGPHYHSFATGGVSNAHQHGFSTGGVSNAHQHSFTTGGVSNAHQHGFGTGGASSGHTHTVSGTTGASGTLTHTANTATTVAVTVTEATVGGTTAVDTRGPGFVVQWVIWT